MDSSSDRTQRLTVIDVVTGFDLFGLPIPSFNLKGKGQVSTFPGGFLSLTIGLVTILFALQKFQHLLQRRNPSINYRTEFNELHDASFDLGQPDFQIAFGLESRYNHSILNDPRYVRWGVRLYTAENGPDTTRSVRLRPCTEADYEKFYPPETQAVSQVQ